MKLAFYILISLLLSNNTWGQQKINSTRIQTSNKVKELIEKIKKYEYLPCLEEFHGVNLLSKWNDLLELEKLTTWNEAIEQLKHPNKYVKALSFYSLILKEEASIFPILISNLHHNERIEIDPNVHDCDLYNEEVSDFFITLSYVYGRISEYEKSELKRKIITENIKIESRDNFIFQSEPKDSLYEEIRKIAIEENNEYAIYALSKYNYEQDIFLIKQLLESKESKYWGFNCVSNYPLPEFLPYIENYLKKAIKKRRRLEFTTYREAYEALIKIDNQKSFEIVEFVLNNCNNKVIGYHKKYIYQALKKFPSERFNSILKELEKEKSIFQY